MISVCLDYHHAAICLCCQTYEIILVSWCFGVQPRQAFMIDAKHAGIQLSSTNLISSVQRIWIGAIHHCCTDQWCYVSFYTYCSRLSRLFIWPRRVLFLLSEVQQSDFFSLCRQFTSFCPWRHDAKIQIDTGEWYQTEMWLALLLMINGLLNIAHSVRIYSTVAQ